MAESLPNEEDTNDKQTENKDLFTPQYPGSRPGLVANLKTRFNSFSIRKLGRLTKCYCPPENSFDDASHLDQILRQHEAPQDVKHFILNGNEDLTCIPLSLGLFSNVIVLDLQRNGLNEFPKAIPMYLKKLEVLDLALNKITDIPPIITWLSCLKELRLANNNLVSLPTELISLEKLEILEVIPNPQLISPPEKICTKGKDAIFNALKCRKLRRNVWEDWQPSLEIDTTDGLKVTKSLQELCVKCILKYDVTFFPLDFVPPVMKVALCDASEEKQNSLKLGKCSHCNGYFSSEKSYENHPCLQSLYTTVKQQ